MIANLTILMKIVRFSRNIFRITVNCSKDWHNIYIYKDRSVLPNMFRKRDDLSPLPVMMENQRRKRAGT